MTGLDPYVGHVLDDKYRLERLLGRGGMGAVYLATHLGTERYVALKLITPQFMRNEEFVERFKREARAAGRLRHPNVVDVTDFGFAHAGSEPVAYLVMEYLDGCTLGDVLAEEQRLPLEWVADILDQVCSAVHEAHQQGIVHRDLKPDNIWLEPNRLGGYRVKVLDFGIAKLAELDAPTDVSTEQVQSPMSTFQGSVNTGDEGAENPTAGQAAKGVSEIETLLFTADKTNSPHESRTGEAAKEPSPHPPTTVGPQSVEANSTQVRSAGVTQAYSAVAPTMTPFEPGNATNDAPTGAEDTHLTSHPIKAQPPNSSAPIDGDLTLKLDQATRRMDFGLHTTLPAGASQGAELTRVGAIMGTPIYMSPEQCAAKPLDARSDIYSLGVIAYQMLAGEPPFSGDTLTVIRDHKEAAPPHLRERAKKVPKRAAGVVMAALAKDPADRPQTAVAFANSLRAEAEGIGSLYRRAFALYSEYFPKFLRLSFIAHIPVILTTILLVGLEIADHYRPQSGTVAKVLMVGSVVLVGLLQIVAYFLASAAISGMTAVIVTQLSVAPLRPVELSTAFAVLKKRWRAFLRTSIRITIRQIIGFILFVIPGIVISVRYMLYAPVVLMEGLEKKAALRRARELASRSWRTVSIIVVLQFMFPITVSALLGRLTVGTGGRETGVHFTTSSITHQIYQQVSGLVNIFIIPLTSIVSALLYLKMRQLGGETLTAALDQVEDVDVERSEWQRRMRTRLSGNTPRGSMNTPRSR